MAIPEDDGLSAFRDTRFWKKFLGRIEQNDLRQKWLKEGEKAENLIVRRIKGGAKQRSDLINALATILKSTVGEILYNDPIPTCKAKRRQVRHLEDIWKKLLTNVAQHNEFTHQHVAGLFLCWGVGVLKVVPTAEGIGFVTVRPQDMIFDEHWIKYGGEPYTRAYIFGERIWKRLSELRDDDSYVADARAQIVQTMGTREPAEVQEVEIWEFNIRIGDKWMLATYCDKSTVLLQFDIEPINEPTYAFLTRPGPIGLNNGHLADVVGLDIKSNAVLKRSAKLGANRMTAIFYNQNKTTKADILKAKDGVPLIGVDVPEGGNLGELVKEIHAGQMTEGDASFIGFMRSLMEWQSGYARDVTRPGGKPVTATETQFVAMKEQRKSAPWLKLVDRYLDRAMYLAALWLKYLWDMEVYDLFTDVLDEEEYEELANWMPHLSEDLQEFLFGVESGSTQQMRSQDALAQMDHLLQNVQLLDAFLAGEGEQIDKNSFVKRYLRAHDALGNPMDLIRPIEQEQYPEELPVDEGMPGEEEMGLGSLVNQMQSPEGY